MLPKPIMFADRLMARGLIRLFTEFSRILPTQTGGFLTEVYE